MGPRAGTEAGRWTIEAETLLEVAGLLNSSLERDQVLGTLAGQFLRIVAADWVVVADATPDGTRGFTLAAGAFQGERATSFEPGAALSPPGTDALERALSTRAPVWTIDSIDRLAGAEAQPLKAVSLLAVPLLFREEVLGCLVAGWHRRAKKPSPKEMRLIQGVANQAATAVQNARLHAATERRAAQVVALFEIAHDISAHLQLTDILSSIVQKAKALLGTDASYLSLLSPDREELEMVASDGLTTEAMRRLRLRREQGLGGAVVQGGRPIVVEDYYGDTRFVDPPMETVQQEGLIAHIAVPLDNGRELLGVLYVGNRRPTRFRQGDAQLLMAFAKQATIAIQNARLYQEALAQRERSEADRRRLQVVLDSMPEGVVLVEGSGGRVATMNRAGMELLGVESLDQQELAEYGRSIGLFSAEGTPMLMDDLPLYRTLREGVICLGAEILIRRANGHQIALLVNSAPFRDPEGRVSGAVAVFQDISRSREAEQLKDEFISLVSHELRTPLTSIKGAARTLLRHYGVLKEETRQELLRDVDEEADRLYRLVENLLDFSRSEAGMLRLATEPVHLGKLAARVVAEVQERAPGHVFGVHFADDLPAVEADPVRVEQVLRNLLDNAIKYSPSGGPIDVWGRLADRMLEVAVRDRGIGIAARDRERVFNRFQRASGATVGHGRGAGLGLAICRRLVEAHGGRIWVESKPFVGSTFFFTLPVVQEEWG